MTTTNKPYPVLSAEALARFNAEHTSHPVGSTRCSCGGTILPVKGERECPGHAIGGGVTTGTLG